MNLGIQVSNGSIIVLIPMIFFVKMHVYMLLIILKKKNRLSFWYGKKTHIKTWFL